MTDASSNFQKIDKIALLAQCPLFSGLSQWELKSISQLMRIVEYKKNEVVYKENGDADSFYVVVWHRNHLGIMSALPVGVTSSNCTAVYDFTGSETAAYSMSQNGQTRLFNGRYGMIVGDSNIDGIVNAADRVAVRNMTGQTGYLSEDLSMDGIVNAYDRILVRRNSTRISQVP